MDKLLGETRRMMYEQIISIERQIIKEITQNLVAEKYSNRNENLTKGFQYHI